MSTLEDFEELDKNFQKILAVVLPENLNVDAYGLCFRGQECKVPIEWATIKLLLKYIPQRFTKHKSQKKYWNVQSNTGNAELNYWCKQEKNELFELYGEVGRGDGVLIFSGEFIIAMILLGYEFKPEFKMWSERKNETEPWKLKVSKILTFNANYLHQEEVLCECGLKYVKDQKYHHFKSKKHQKEMLKKNTTHFLPFSPP